MKQRPTNDQTLKDVLKDLVKAYRLKPKLNQAKIQNIWAGLMGPTISDYTKSISIRKKTLYITIESAALRQELSYAKDKIKSLVNEKLGENYIETVVIH